MGKHRSVLPVTARSQMLQLAVSDCLSREEAMQRAAQSLGQVIQQLIRDLGIDKKIQEQQLVARWPEVVGEPIASHARAVACEGGTLFVEVESASWRHELLYMKPLIIERLNQVAERHIIQDIMLTNTRK